MNRLRKTADKASNAAIRLFTSDRFFYAVIILAVLQGLWYALSFQPSIFDEGKHIGRILVYSQNLSPFLGEQNPAWDHLGNVSRNGSYLYYYIMSWPLRFVSLFTQNETIQIIFLRLASICFFVGGLAIYRRALLMANMPKGAVNLTFLFLILTPSVAPLAGAVNYDNLVFLLFAILLLLSIQIIKSKDVDILKLSSVVIASMLLAVVKWTSVALIAPVVTFLVFDLFKKNGKRVLTALFESIKRTEKWRLAAATVLILLSGFLFVERPIMNIVRYGEPGPTCVEVIGRERCLEYPDYVIYQEVDSNIPQNFEPISPSHYFTKYWAPRMISTQVSLLPLSASRINPTLPVIQAVYFVLSALGAVLLLLNLRRFSKNNIYKFLMFITSIFTVILFIKLYNSYTTHAIPAAIRMRYMIPVMPIILSFVALAFTRVFRRHLRAGVFSLVVVLLLLTQGGGITTHLLTAQNQLYWQNPYSLGVNREVRSAVSPLIKE